MDSFLAVWPHLFWDYHLLLQDRDRNPRLGRWLLLPWAARLPLHVLDFSPVILMQHLCLSILRHKADLWMPISQQKPRWKVHYQTKHETARASSRRGCNLAEWPQLQHGNAEENLHSSIMKISGWHATVILNNTGSGIAHLLFLRQVRVGETNHRFHRLIISMLHRTWCWHVAGFFFFLQICARCEHTPRHKGDRDLLITLKVLGKPEKTWAETWQENLPRKCALRNLTQA